MSQYIQKVKVYQKLLLGIGELTGCLSNTIIGFFYLFYLTDIIDLRPAYAGAAILLGRIWDAVNDPLMGMISDRTRSRWGRRRVFLLLGAFPVGISFFLLWIASPLWSQFQKFTYASLSYILHTTALTVIVLPYQKLTVEMTSDYDERTSITAYRMVFSILGGLVGVVIPKMITEGYSSKFMGYMVMGIVFAVIIGIAPLFPFAGCSECGSSKSFPFDPLKDIRTIWLNKPFRLILVMYMVTWTAINLLETMFMYFFKYWLNMDNQFDIIVGLIFIIAALCLPLWVKLSSSMGKKNAFTTGVGFLAICVISVIFIKPGLKWLVYIICAFIGIGISAAHVMPHSIIPDSVDYGQAQTGEQREGMYYGFLTFVQQIGTASAIALSGLILDLLGYIPDRVQTRQMLLAIRILLGPVPGVLLLIGIVCIYFYPIDREMYNIMRQQINLKRGV